MVIQIICDISILVGFVSLNHQEHIENSTNYLEILYIY